MSFPSGMPKKVSSIKINKAKISLSSKARNPKTAKQSIRWNSTKNFTGVKNSFSVTKKKIVSLRRIPVLPKKKEQEYDEGARVTQAIGNITGSMSEMPTDEKDRVKKTTLDTSTKTRKLRKMVSKLSGHGLKVSFDGLIKKEINDKRRQHNSGKQVIRSENTVQNDVSDTMATESIHIDDDESPCREKPIKPRVILTSMKNSISSRLMTVKNKKNDQNDGNAVKYHLWPFTVTDENGRHLNMAIVKPRFILTIKKTSRRWHRTNNNNTVHRNIMSDTMVTEFALTTTDDRDISCGKRYVRPKVTFTSVKGVPRRMFSLKIKNKTHQSETSNHRNNDKRVSNKTNIFPRADATVTEVSSQMCQMKLAMTTGPHDADGDEENYNERRNSRSTDCNDNKNVPITPTETAMLQRDIKINDSSINHNVQQQQHHHTTWPKNHPCDSGENEMNQKEFEEVENELIKKEITHLRTNELEYTSNDQLQQHMAPLPKIKPKKEPTNQMITVSPKVLRSESLPLEDFIDAVDMDYLQRRDVLPGDRSIRTEEVDYFLEFSDDDLSEMMGTMEYDS